MSIAGIGTAALYSAFEGTQGTSNGQGSIQSEFQQLGQDLQTGNLAQAQEDFATLSQNFTNSNQTSNAANNTNNNPIAQAFNALSQDLQNGNLSAAQQDYATIQQDVQQQGQQGTSQTHHHHHHGGGGGGGQEQSQINQAFNSLSQALQSNNLSGAQSAFATLQQDLQQFTQASGANATGQTSGSSETTGNNLSVMA